VSHGGDYARRRLRYGARNDTVPTSSIGAEPSSSIQYDEITSAVEMVSLDGIPHLGSPLSPEVKERMAASRADALARRVAALERQLAAIEERANAPCLHCSGEGGTLLGHLTQNPVLQGERSSYSLCTLPQLAS
jgi:hypothetical protein